LCLIRLVRLRTACAGRCACAVFSILAPRLHPTEAAAQPPAELYEGHVQVDRGQPDDPETLTGQVFDDVNQNSKLDGDEKGVAGVAVSNGVDVVQTEIGRAHV